MLRIIIIIITVQVIFGLVQYLCSCEIHAEAGITARVDVHAVVHDVLAVGAPSVARALILKGIISQSEYFIEGPKN